MKNITYNPLFLMKDGKPWLPISGEMQYSRTRREEWRESLYKMKACGLDIVQTYVFWLHHEEDEGEYDFSGNRSLRDFLQEVKNAGMFAYLRVGPWPHGEARNGGFPDWLLEKGWSLRDNDERYLAKVDEYFGKLGEQARGFMYDDGGPIIGIQVENEHGGPCGGVPGEAGQEHMRILRRILEKHGFSAALWSATAWGGASTGGMLPMWGGYPEAPWDLSDTELPANKAYLIREGRNDVNIGSDGGKRLDAADTIEGFPYFTAELGAGVQISRARRPIISDRDAGALMLSKMASGVNLFGYYIFHGGVNPIGKHSFMNEYRGYNFEPGWTSDVPELSYDFQAPIREFGQIRQSYKEMKLLGLFLRDFGDDLATLQTHIPADEPTDAADTEHIRWSTRDDGQHGYFFVNNYQRRYVMNVHTAVNIEIPLKSGKLKLPEFDLHDGDFFFWPFNMKLGNAVMKTAKASPLCRINNTFVFYADGDPEYDLDGDAEILTISRSEALDAHKITLDRDYLFISDSLVIKTDRGVEVIGRDTPKFRVFPDLTEAPKGFERVGEENGFAVYEKSIEKVAHSVGVRSIGKGEYEIDIDYHGEANNAFLQIDYGGNTAKLYHDGEYIADNFYNGTMWEIALERFGYPKKLKMIIEPLKKDTVVFLEKRPTLFFGEAKEIYDARVVAEYKNMF